MPTVRHKRGTRAALNALSASNSLVSGQLYVLTDEGRIAVALTSSTYQAFLKEGEVTMNIDAGTPAAVYGGYVGIDGGAP